MHFSRFYPRSAPRIVAALITSVFTLSAVSATASATNVTDICSNSSTSWIAAGSGLWDDASDWSNGVPSSTCSVSITEAGTYTVTLTPYSAGGDSQQGDGVASITLGNPGGSGTQTLDVEGEGSISNSNETQNMTELGVIGSMQINASGRLILDATPNDNGNGGPDGGYATLDVAQPSTNSGTIISQNEDPAWKNNIDGQLSNAGTVDINSGVLDFEGSQITGGAMTLSNTGTWSVASGATAAIAAGDGSTFTQGSGTYANNGTTTVTGSMHWNENGGAESGNPIQITGGETFDDAGGTGSFEWTNCTTAGVLGTIPAGQTITVNGGCSGTTLYMGPSSTTPIANHGTIILNAPAGGSDGILAGDVELDNYGTIDSNVGGAQPLLNQLLLPLVNEAGGTVNLTDGELAQTTGSTTTNAGTVNIGPGATWLVQGGAFTNNGTLGLQIAGATSLGTLNLTVGSKFNAGGTLAPTLVSGYQPAAGTEFPIITENGGSVVGSFASVTGSFSADYSKESASPGYLGAIYSGAANAGGSAGTTTTTTGPVRPSVQKLSGGAGKLTLKLSCAKSATAGCAYALTGTVGKRKVLSGHGTVKAGKSVTLTVKLNKAGLALLKKRHRLRVKVLVTARGKTLKSATVTVTRASKKKKK